MKMVSEIAKGALNSSVTLSISPNIQVFMNQYPHWASQTEARNVKCRQFDTANDIFVM